MAYWQSKTAVVTGGGSGIGRALAMAMAQRGGNVVVADINEEAAIKVASECGSSAKGYCLKSGLH